MPQRVMKYDISVSRRGDGASSSHFSLSSEATQEGEGEMGESCHNSLSLVWILE